MESSANYMAPPGDGGTAPSGFLHQTVRLISTLFGSCRSRTLAVNGRRLRVLRQIAEGGYSYVLLAQEGSGATVAVKQMLLQTAEARAGARREVEMHLAFTSHGSATNPHIMPLLDYSIERIDGEGRERALLVFPFYARGTLQDVLLRQLSNASSSSAFFDEATALHYIAGAAAGVAAMHARSPPWAHRDVCPRNICISDSGDAVLIDLGSAVPARVPLRTRLDALRAQEEASIHSSQPYRAPELWDPPSGGAAALDEKVDIWSLGATLYALLFGYSPFESQRGDDGSLRIAECSHVRTLAGVTFPLRPPASDAVKEFILAMLAPEPSARPSAAAVAERARELLAGLAAGGSGAGSGFVAVSISGGSSAGSAARPGLPAHAAASSRVAVAGDGYAALGSPVPAARPGKGYPTAGAGAPVGGGAISRAAVGGAAVVSGPAGHGHEESDFNPFAAVAAATSSSRSSGAAP